MLTLVLAGYQGVDGDRWLSPRSTGRWGASGLAEALERLGAIVQTRHRSLRSPLALDDAGRHTLILGPGPEGDSAIAASVFGFAARGGHVVLTTEWLLAGCAGVAADSGGAPSWCPKVGVRTDTLASDPDDGEPLVLRLHATDGGAVTVFTESQWLTNGSLREHARRGEILGWVHAGRDRVIFQEARAMGARPLIAAVARWAAGAPLGWAMLQLGLAAVALVLLGAIRTGPVVPGIERRRRSAVEHADALAVGLRRGSGARTAVNLLVAGLRRRVRGRPGLATPEENRAWLHAFAASVDDGRARAAVLELANLQLAADGDPAVLRAATLVEDVWTKVGRRQS